MTESNENKPKPKSVAPAENPEPESEKDTLPPEQPAVAANPTEKFNEAMEKLVGAPVQPLSGANQATPPQDFSDQMKKAVEETQRITEPWVQLLVSKLANNDPLAHDIMLDLSHAGAQLVRYITDEMERTGHRHLAVQVYNNPQIFTSVAIVFLQQPGALYAQNPGPDYWMNYLKNNVTSDLSDRVQKLQKRQQPQRNPSRPGVKAVQRIPTRRIPK